MKAIVKSIWMNSASLNLDEYLPDCTESFGLWVEFSVGIKDEDGADDFRIFVCTPEWLKNECTPVRSIWGRHMLIVSEYNIDLIKAEIDQCVENCTGENWPTIAPKIARFAAWEFEDYQP